MPSDNQDNQEPRKITDVILSLEEKITLLIKTIAANDMNNRLILDRLNKLVNQTTIPSLPAAQLLQPNQYSNTPINVGPPSVEISQEPFISRKGVVPKELAPPPPKDEKKVKAAQANLNKIPVGQRITDNTGKDLFMANVVITNIANGEEFKCKTNAAGKWQAYLSVGKYSVMISKVIDALTLQKIESLQHIEIDPKMKALQLPTAIITR